MTSAREINRLLEARIVELCHRLMPKGAKHGREYKDAPSKAGGVIGDSMSVCIDGRNKGAWRHYGAGGRDGRAKAGGPIDLIGYCLGKDFDAALEWARDVFLAGIVEDSSAHSARPDSAGRARKQMSEAEYKAWSIAEARRLWQTGRSLAGTRGATYLESRGLAMLTWPSCARFHPQLWHEKARQSFPAIVCAMRPPVLIGDGDGECGVGIGGGDVSGVWRIYLRADGGGKAPVDAPRLGRGDCWGKAIWLPQTIHMPPGRLAIVEGFEKGLGLQLLFPRWPVAVATSGGNMAELVRRLSKDMVRELMIAGDNDSEHTRRDGSVYRPGQDFVRAALRAAREREIRAMAMIPGVEDQDWDDLLANPGVRRGVVPAATTARGNDAS